MPKSNNKKKKSKSSGEVQNRFTSDNEAVRTTTTLSTTKKSKSSPASSSPLTSRTSSKSSLLSNSAGAGTAEPNHSNNNNNNNGTSKRSQKRARQEALEDDEEARLTALLFGGSGGASGGGVVAAVWSDEDDDDDGRTSRNVIVDDEPAEEEPEDDLAFEIDRTGLEVDGEGESSQLFDQNVTTAGNDDEDNHASNDDEDDGDSDGNDTDASDKIMDSAPVWDDPDDDDDAKIRLVDASNRLKKLRKSRNEKQSLSTHELEQRLRERYETSTQATARTDWASAPLARPPTKRQSTDFEQGGAFAAALFSTSESLLATGDHNGGRLAPNILDIIRCPDANQDDPNNAVVQAVHFHPGSDPDRPLVLTAGLDKTLRFFQVGEEKSEKIHGIHFPKMPIYSANFLGNTGKVIVSGRRSFFYLYDAVSGNVDLVPRILGRDERSWEKHAVSPDGQLIAFVGNDGYVVLFDSHSKHSVGTLKLNGSVRAITFTPDGSNILASGSDGDVYRWDVKSRKCIERFANGDGTITSSLAASSTRLAVGAESGVVNLYSEHQSQYQSSLYTPSQNGMTSKTPLKSIMNLPTSNDALKFNPGGQILAFSSQREHHGLKLLHVPSQTVFANWPTSKTPLRYVWSMDFSPQSKFLAIGNDKGKCLLYKLNHFHDA